MASVAAVGADMVVAAAATEVVDTAAVAANPSSLRKSAVVMVAVTEGAISEVDTEVTAAVAAEDMVAAPKLKPSRLVLRPLSPTLPCLSLTLSRRSRSDKRSKLRNPTAEVMAEDMEETPRE